MPIHLRSPLSLVNYTLKYNKNMFSYSICVYVPIHKLSEEIEKKKSHQTENVYDEKKTKKPLSNIAAPDMIHLSSSRCGITAIIPS